MFKQTYNPSINLRGYHYAGMCLQWVDDAGNAPKRTPLAKTAYDNEVKAKRLRTSQLPEGIWIPVWFSFSRGSYTYPNGYTIYYKDAWHVALAKRVGKKVYVRDSEFGRYGRNEYQSLAEVERWFGAYGAKYVGWSTHCDGREFARWFAPAKPKRISRAGRAKVTTGLLNVRDGYSTKNKKVAEYKKGQSFNYDSYIDANGYRWLSYVSYSGKRRYVAQGTLDKKTKYVSGGV